MSRWIRITRRFNPVAEVLWSVVYELRALNCSVAEIAKRIKPPKPEWTLKGGMFMYVVKVDNPDVGYHITEPTVTDSEGHTVPPTELTLAVVSDNPTAVEVLPSDKLNGTVHFGALNTDGTPTIANLTVTVANSAGALLGSFGAQFTLVAGDPAAIAGGSIAFDGLSEV